MNLQTLMAADGAPYTSAKAIASRAQMLGKKLSYKTVERTIAQTTEPALNTVEAIARVYGLEAWQLLIPGLQPGERPEMRRELALETQ